VAGSERSSVLLMVLARQTHRAACLGFGINKVSQTCLQACRPCHSICCESLEPAYLVGADLWCNFAVACPQRVAGVLAVLRAVDSGP